MAANDKTTTPTLGKAFTPAKYEGEGYKETPGVVRSTSDTGSTEKNDGPPTPHPYSTRPWYTPRALIHWIKDRDYHVWTMSFGFLILFTSYPIQGVQTIRYGHTGSYLLIALYSAYMITSMWATYFLSWWGLEFCLIWGPISYGTWIACMFSDSIVANFVGAAFFGWGAGILWPAAGQLIATVSSPHNRASNAGIYQCFFHIGSWAGGLILGAVQKRWTNYHYQYAVFLALCLTSAVWFFLHGISFRRRFRRSQEDDGGELGPGSGSEGPTKGLHRVQLDDGTVKYRQVDKNDLRSEDAVVQDLALSGTKGTGPTFSWESIKANFLNPIKMLGNSVFGPLGPVIFLTGGISQGWFNASFNQVVYKVGGDWNGWIYAIAESWAIVASIVFGLFYDKLRKNYTPGRYRWIMYINIVAWYAMCGLALGTTYLGEQGIGHEPGQISPAKYKAALSFVGALYNVQLLALEVSVLTYLSTFLTYNADVAFSSKIACEAAGYLLTFGLVNVLSPKWFIVFMFCIAPPCHAVYLFGWWAPERPVATSFVDASKNSSKEAVSDGSASS